MNRGRNLNFKEEQTRWKFAREKNADPRRRFVLRQKKLSASGRGSSGLSPRRAPLLEIPGAFSTVQALARARPLSCFSAGRRASRASRKCPRRVCLAGPRQRAARRILISSVSSSRKLMSRRHGKLTRVTRDVARERSRSTSFVRNIAICKSKGENVCRVI